MGGSKQKHKKWRALKVIASAGQPSTDDPRQFDYETISDVILRIRYTAREGGGLLRKGAVKNLNEAVDPLGGELMPRGE